MNGLTRGEWIRRNRIEVGMKLKELAKKLDLHAASVSRMERGVQPVTREVFEKCKEIFGVPEDNQGFIGLAPPLQQPPRAEHFTGRKKELAQLLVDLQPGRVVTLCGPGGIGKTALAAEVVWTLAPKKDPPERFPDGIIFHSFYNQPEANYALEQIARSFGEEPRPTPRDAVRRALANRQALLIFDGAENADDLQAVLDVRGGCGVLVTSRKHEDTTTKRLDIAPLSLDDAIALLRAWGEAWAADEASVRRICELIGRLPLAVRLVGRYLVQTKQNAVEYLTSLKESTLQALDHGQRQQKSVPVLMERSVKQVSEEAQQALSVAGLLSINPFPPKVVAVGLGVSIIEVRQLLGELVNYGLLTRTDEGYLVTHALIHTYARQELPLSSQILTKVATYYTSKSEQQQFDPRHAVHILAKCREEHNWEAIWGLYEVLGWTTDMADYYIGAALTGEFSLKLINEKEMNEGIKPSKEELDFAASFRKFSKRIFESGFAPLLELGETCYHLGKMEQAIEYYEHALFLCGAGDKLYGHADDRRYKIFESEALSGLGDIYHHLEQREQAIEAYQKAIKLDPDNAPAYDNLARIYLELGQGDKAVHIYYPQVKFQPDNRLNAFVTFGVMVKHQGEEEFAKKSFEEALSLWETDSQQLEQLQSKYEGLAYVALAQLGLGQIEMAINTLKQALAQFLPEDTIDFTLYDLLADAPQPPAGLAEMRRLLTEFEDQYLKNNKL